MDDYMTVIDNLKSMFSNITEAIRTTTKRTDKLKPTQFATIISTELDNTDIITALKGKFAGCFNDLTTSATNAEVAAAIKNVNAINAVSVLSIEVWADQEYGTYNYDGGVRITDITTGKTIFNGRNGSCTTKNGIKINVSSSGGTVYGEYAPYTNATVTDSHGNVLCRGGCGSYTAFVF